MVIWVGRHQACTPFYNARLGLAHCIFVKALSYDYAISIIQTDILQLDVIRLYDDFEGGSSYPLQPSLQDPDPDNESLQISWKQLCCLRLPLYR